MTTRKTDLLIKDIAALFVKYGASDWRPILEELAEGTEMQVQIAHAIFELCEQTQAAKTKSRGRVGSVKRKKATSARRPTSASSSSEAPVQLSFSLGRSSALEALAKLLNDRLILPSAADLRQMYLLVGGKQLLPKTRAAAVVALLAALDQAPEQTYRDALESMKATDSRTSNQEDYARWFNLIRPPRGEKD